MPQNITQRQYPVRFTPDELMELDQNGKLTPEIIKQLHPQDQLTLEFLRKTSVDTPAGPMAVGMGSLGLSTDGPAAKLFGGGVVQGAKNLWNKAAPTVGAGIGAGVGALVGHPWVGATIGGRVGEGFKFAPPVGPPPKPPVTRLTGPMSERAAVNPSVMESVEENVQRGVQNNFEPGKRVTFAPGTAPNGQIADMEAFQRALEEELTVIKKYRHSAQGYADWEAAQEAKIPPVGTPVEELANKGLQSLRRKPK